MEPKLSLVWYKNCITPEQKKSREELVRNSVQLSVLLLSILEDKYEFVEKKGFKEEDYANNGWQTLQAFRNGKMAAYAEIAEMFQHLTKEVK